MWNQKLDSTCLFKYPTSKIWKYSHVISLLRQDINESQVGIVDPRHPSPLNHPIPSHPIPSHRVRLANKRYTSLFPLLTSHFPPAPLDFGFYFFLVSPGLSVPINHLTAPSLTNPNPIKIKSIKWVSAILIPIAHISYQVYSSLLWRYNIEVFFFFHSGIHWSFLPCIFNIISSLKFEISISTYSLLSSPFPPFHLLSPFPTPEAININMKPKKKKKKKGSE